MTRKKIEDIIFDYGFEPSEYQRKIFEFIKYGVGNCVIKAGAGAGKTLTAVTSMNLIPNKQKCLFIAFNKSIVNELSKKLEHKKNATVRTLHSLGYLMLQRNCECEIEIDEYKYRSYVKQNICDLTTILETEKLTPSRTNQYIENIISLIDLCRFNNAQSIKEIKRISEKYSVPSLYDEYNVVKKVLKWGCKNITKIDYTDMLWLPNELSLNVKGLQYDWIFIDEAQDLSIAAVQLILKCFKRGTRFVAIGDKNQSINGFAGSSEEAFEFLCNYKHTQTFELPITYRCDKKITEFANKIVPSLQCRNNAQQGKIKYSVKINEIKDGDMILARTKAPLIALYNKLLRRNINCYIKGQDIGLNLIKIIDCIPQDDLNQDLKYDGVFVRLYDKLFNERNRLMEKYELDFNDSTLSSYIMNLYDSINTLQILSENLKTKKELIEKIKKIFCDENDGICLSTIHKAKGLESNNVFLLCHSAMPFKLAKSEWEIEQEKNLMYVAYTRAKHCLGFISESEIPPMGSLRESNDIITDLKVIEYKVCQILNKKITEQIEICEVAKHNIKKATIIKDIHENDNVVVLNKNKKNVKNIIDELDNCFNFKYK